jgi:hypothetical protein
VIKIDLAKAKEVAHGIRKADRDKQMEPHDKAIMMQIPGTPIIEIEAKRQVVRDENAVVQTNIDNAQDEVELKAAIADMIK